MPLSQGIELPAGRKDLPDFIQLVPMGDAEVVRLQRDGYVFMR